MCYPQPHMVWRAFSHSPLPHMGFSTCLSHAADCCRPWFSFLLFALFFSRTVRVSCFDRTCLFSSGWGASTFFYQVYHMPHVLWWNFSLNIMRFSPCALRAFLFVWEEELQSNWCLNLLDFPPSYFFSALGRRESIYFLFSLCSLFFLRLYWDLSLP